MQLTIFGATGMVGMQLVKQAIFNGHQVRAFGRNVFTANMPKSDHLELVQGALFDEKEVRDVIKGCDAVLSALGGALTGADFTRSLGIKNIVAQMEKTGVKRIISVASTALLTDADGESLLMDKPEYPAKFLPVGREHLKGLGYLKASDLDWTVVCPPEIVDKEPTGEFKTMADFPPETQFNKITSGDLALFMLSELEKNEFVHHRVGISNG